MTGLELRVSLVVATIGRVPELDALLASLAAQEHPSGLAPSFEVVVIDQSGDDRLVPLLSRPTAGLSILHLRSEIRAVSHARNIALGHCRGAIVGFPDDDCTYPPGVLAAVETVFRANPGVDVVSGVVADPDGRPGPVRWPSRAGDITPANVWQAVMSAGLFVRLPALRRLGGFDERLGIGAAFGSAEETDLVLRALSQGSRALFDPSIRIAHPNRDVSRTPARRAFDYGRGFGFVLFRHRFPVRTLARYAIRPLGGMLLAALRFRAGLARYYAGMLLGRASGYLAGLRAGDHAA